MTSQGGAAGRTLRHELLDVDVATGIDRRVLEVIGDTRAVAATCSAADGTRLAYKDFGAVDAPALLFCNGLGGTYRTFADVFAPLLATYRVLTFDYRGLFESGPPVLPDAIDVPTHATDVMAVLDHAGVDRAVLFGWSMGVQVALEVYRLQPRRVSALVFASGVEGRLLDSVGPLRAGERWAPLVVRILRDNGQLATLALARVVRHPVVARAAAAVGLVGRNADVTMAHAALLLSTDPRRYWGMAEELQRQDARDLLERIDVPVLVLHGDADVLTPVSKGRELRTAIPGAEVWVFAGCRHAVILEYPERVARRIADFVRRRVLSAT